MQSAAAPILSVIVKVLWINWFGYAFVDIERRNRAVRLCMGRVLLQKK